MGNLLALPPEHVAIDSNTAIIQLGTFDADDFHQFVAADHAVFDRWFTFTESWSPKKAADYCNQAETESICGRGVYYWILYHGLKSGVVNLQLDRSEAPDTWHTSYLVSPRVAGQGLASGAVRAVTEVAFSDLGAEAVNMYIDPSNKASQRVAVKVKATQLQRFKHGKQIWSITDDR